MLKKKICMLGSFAVGKTSLVQRFVSNTFSDKYLTTIGVKVEQKTLSLDGKEMTLVLWDMHGDDSYQRVKSSYLRGASGYFLVADGTRAETIEKALELRRKFSNELDNLPFLMLLNKADLLDEWCEEALDDDFFKFIEVDVIRTSAKSGEGVENAFERLAAAIC